MTGRRKLSHSQVVALQALAEHRTKILGFTAEFEARKAKEYSEAASGLRDEEAQLVANLLDLDTPKIRIAEVMGTKNYGNLLNLHEAAQQYRKFEDPAQGKPKPVEVGSLADKEVREFLHHLDKFVQFDAGTANEYGEWEEIWDRPDGARLTFLCWDNGQSLLSIEGLRVDLMILLDNEYQDTITHGIYGEEQA